jgi:RNA polymerase sigma-70 factor (ECF subfamily)
MYTGKADQIRIGYHLNIAAEIGWLAQIGPLLSKSWYRWLDVWALQTSALRTRIQCARLFPDTVGHLLDRTLAPRTLERSLPRHVMSRANDLKQEDAGGRRRKGKTDPEFLSRLQAGDERAWEQLIADWQGPLYQHLCYSLPSPEIAADVLQDTLEALVTALQRFDGKVAISTFIYSIASRKVADYFRKRKVTGEIPETLSSERLNISSDSIVFRDVLNELQPQYREALLLRYQMGLSVSELAQVLGRSYKATESLLSRSRRQLEANLGKSGFGL